MTTLRSLCTGSLRLLNAIQAGESPSPDDINVSVQALNGILDSWSTEKLFTFTVKPYTLTLQGSKQSYTIGPGGDLDIPRPLTIEQALVNTDQAGGKFFLPLALIPMDQYANIKFKDMSSTFPQAIYDDQESPLKTIYLWPVPTQGSELTLWCWVPLVESTDLDEEITLPPGYERALRFTLAVELAAEFGKEVPPNVLSIAASSVGKIKRMNSKNFKPLMTPNTSFSNPFFNWMTGGF